MKSVRGRNERKRIRGVRGDNRGMSLLELIIAVAIFSIAAVSLLQAFVTSGNINKKSNLYLEATTTAQNVMEEIKAKSFTDIAGAFNYPTTTGTSGVSCRFSFLESQKENINNGSLIIQEVLKNTSSGTTSYGKVTKYSDQNNESSVTASVISTDGGLTYTLNPRTKGSNASKYYFEMTGVECLKETFDILVEFDGSGDTSYKKSSSLSTEDEKNDYEMPNIAKLNRDENGLLIRSEDWGLEMVETWCNNNPTQPDFKLFDDCTETERQEKYEEILAKVVRTLTVRLREDGGIITAEAQQHFEYTASDGTLYCSDCDKVNSTHADGYNDNYTAFFSTEVGKNLEGLYVFYYPNYNSTSSATPLDNIIFDNTGGKELLFYVIKQKSDTITSEKEQKYRMSLTVKEIPTKTNWTTNLSQYSAQTVLRTNLGYDISGSSDSAGTSSRKEVKGQMSLTYQSVKSDGVTLGTKITTKAADVLGVNDLDDREATDRIYTVKVSVYKTGAAADDFPDDDLVVTLDGAKED